MKVTRKIIEINEDLCNGCGECVVACDEGALEIIDGKAKVIAEVFCDGLGACIGDCPTGALKIVEREADEFDEAAVEEHLEKIKAGPKEEKMACGCPSSQIQSFSPAATPCQSANKPAAFTEETSALSNWPVQINLIPPNAPFLKGANLLIAADCVPVAFPSLHQDLLKGRSVMIGCPKFDDTDAYIKKFAEIFRISGIKSITSVIMEVPCCAGLRMVIKKALELSNKDIPLEEIIVSTRGKIVKNL
ncbi:MAG: 4Fe-4S binding protein [Desulfobacterales bacterium]|nr:4Fe-4S binding protein [Desulfobacterales bacterium]